MESPNPYASPQTESPVFRPEDIVLRVDNPPPYQSARGKTTFVVVTTSIVIVLQLFMIGSLFMQITLLNDAQIGVVITPERGAANDLRQERLMWLSLAAIIASFIAILVWVYHSHRNLPALQARKLEFSPGWAVGWFFIPIMNLFKPYQAILEIWNQSQPGQLFTAAGAAVPAKSGSLVLTWWLLRVVGGIAGRASDKFGSEDGTIEQYLAVSWVAIALILVLNIPMFVCQILLVLQVQKFQDQRQKLVTAAQATPPASVGEQPARLGHPFQDDLVTG